MCGILYVNTSWTRSPELDQQAADLLRARGPDAVFTYQQGSRFLAQTMLHFAGDMDFYQEAVAQGFLYNGEIYNWQQWSNRTDGAVVLKTLDQRSWEDIQQWHGPWAWIRVQDDHVYAATDAGCERHLFQYRDDQTHVISSEIAPILLYVQSRLVLRDFSTKHYPIIQATPWVGIKRLQPGGLYIDGVYNLSLDNLGRWRDDTWEGTGPEAVDRMDSILQSAIQEMLPNEPVSLSVSGGLDSGLLRTYLPAAETITIATDKDTLSQHTGADIVVSADHRTWGQAFQQAQRTMHLPVLSWSLPGWYLVLSHSTHRVMFTGCGADEIFGGYPHARLRQPSPYVDNSAGDVDLAQLHRDYTDPYLLDYVVQTGAVDQLGIDLIAGSLGRETRNPFMHRRVISFAQSLEPNIRTGATGKRILRDVYRARTGQHYLEPKVGFAGHCNDSITDIDPDYVAQGERSSAWRQFILDYFRKSYA